MVAPTLDNGTTKITFNTITTFVPKLQSTKLFPFANIEGAGQEVIDAGAKVAFYTIVATLKIGTSVSDISAFEQWEALETMFGTKESSNKYQRTFIMTKPDGSGSLTIDGKIKQMELTVVSGDSEEDFEVKFDIFPDDFDGSATGGSAPSVPTRTAYTSDSITDSTNTTTFRAISGFSIKLLDESFRIYSIPLTGKQRVSALGKISKTYSLDFALENTSGGDSAWTKFVSLRDNIWLTEHVVYEYQRKITFAKPGTAVVATNGPVEKSINGKIQNIAFPEEMGENIRYGLGNISFLIDNRALAVP